MTPRLHRPGRRTAPSVIGLVAVLAVIAACTGNRNDSCGGDLRAPGVWPDLERKLPTLLDGRPPDSVDSGENCTREALGTLADHGVGALRFAGSTWDFGSGRAVTIAFLTRPDSPLPVAVVEEFYEAGARSAPKTGNTQVSRPGLEGIGRGFRVDTLNDLSLQTVVVWDGGTGGVTVVLVATPVSPSAVRADHDALVERAVTAAAEIG